MQQIALASADEMDIVAEIVRQTIETVYPHYYPSGAVAFFLHHHQPDAIAADISKKIVYLLKNDDTPVGTVTMRDNEICRLFVLPQYQGQGFGRALLDFAEDSIFQHCSEIVIDASLAAKSIYLRRGYHETAYHKIETENGDFLCYDFMVKSRDAKGGRS